jgi:hypothetical protein
MFLHHIAEPSDIINENTKFGYGDHIKLAKKIIGFGGYQSKYYVMNNYCKIKTVLPNIKSIYYKEDINIITIQDKANLHRRYNSNSSNNSTANNSNRSNNRTISISPFKNENNKNDSYENLKNENINNENSSKEILSNNNKSKSRFFDITKEFDIFKNDEFKNLSNIVNGALKRNLFFRKFQKYSQIPSLKELEVNYISNLYEKTNDKGIKLLLENMN